MQADGADEEAMLGRLSFEPSEDPCGYFRMFGAAPVRPRRVRLHLLGPEQHLFRERPAVTIEQQLEGGVPLTQFGRALDELGVEMICSLSPQSRGRIARLWGTLQDRLGERTIDVPTEPNRSTWAKARVDVRELMDRRVRVVREGRVIARARPPGGIRQAHAAEQQGAARARPAAGRDAQGTVWCAGRQTPAGGVTFLPGDKGDIFPCLRHLRSFLRKVMLFHFFSVRLPITLA